MQRKSQPPEKQELLMEPPKSTKQAQSSSREQKGQSSKCHHYPSRVDDCQSDETSTSTASSHQSSPRTKTMRRGMFKEPKHHLDRAADEYTFSGRDYREWSRYLRNADNDERYYENWDDDDDSCNIVCAMAIHQLLQMTSLRMWTL